jgi:hypothetical protein
MKNGIVIAYIQRLFISMAAQCLLLLYLLLWTGAAFGADALSFDPTAVNVKALGAGGVPVGAVIAWPAASNPPEAGVWLDCNGQSTAGYPELAAIVGATVPNYQGMFLRGYGSQNHTQNNGSTIGNTATTHSSGAFGAVQGDATRSIDGGIFRINLGQASWATFESPYGAFYADDWGGGQFHTDSWSSPETGNRMLKFSSSQMVPVSNENRPANIAVRYLIRAKP